jgi:hypothetical protein
MPPPEALQPAPASAPPAREAPAAGPAGQDALLAEHAALAAKLEARRSILEVRRASISLFLGFILVGLTGKLGWDRWGITKPGQVAPAPQHGPALHIWATMLVAIVVLALAIRYYLRAKHLLEEEEALFARFKEVRTALGYDA